MLEENLAQHYSSIESGYSPVLQELFLTQIGSDKGRLFKN